MEDLVLLKKTRGLSSEDARWVRQSGHNDALEFAIAIGLPRDYQNDHRAKKDVIDLSGDAHSVKSGKKKWQIFLYGLGRFESDDAFKVMNGIGTLLIECIKSFPVSFDEYQTNKSEAKEKLRIPMRALLSKSLFNGGEVNYLTIKHGGIFHVFLNDEVIDVLSDNLTVENSKALSIGQVSEQKVIFKYNSLNLAELEMRNDTRGHYREIRFNMIKPRAMQLFFEKIPKKSEFNNKVFIYGNASKKFGRWKKRR